MFCIYHVQWWLNKAPDLLFSEYLQSKVHLQKDALQITTEPDTRVSYLAVNFEALKLHFDMKWNPNIKHQRFAKTEKLKIFSFNAMKMCDSTGTKPFS